MLAAGERVGGETDEAEQSGDVPFDLVGDHLGVVHVGGHLERSDEVEWDAGLRAGRVDREVRPTAQRTDVTAAEPPLPEPVAPQRGLAGSELVGRLAGVARLGFVDPRPEIRRGEIGKGQAQIRQVTLRVDRQHRQAAAQCLFDQDHSEAGLARAGHPHDDAVGGE